MKWTSCDLIVFSPYLFTLLLNYHLFTLHLLNIDYGVD